MSDKRVVQFEIDDDCFFADGVAEWMVEVFKLFNKIPLPRLRAIAEAERDGRVLLLGEPFLMKCGKTVIVDYHDCTGWLSGDPTPTWEERAALSAGKGE